MSIAVVVLTHNRLPLLRQCVQNVIARTSDATTEIVIWDNGSTDGTSEYLGTIEDSRVQIVRSPANVGMVAYARAIAMTRAPYLVQLDDDVVDAPSGWDATLLSAFRHMPTMAWLAADLVDDPNDRLSNDRYRKDTYLERTIGGVPVLAGPTGGWCTMTSRAIYDAVGGLPSRSRLVYFSTDSIYVRKVLKAGYDIGILPGVCVRHSGDRAGAPDPPLKAEFYRREAASVRRRQLVKRFLLKVPGVRSANRRHGWFNESEAT